MNLSREGARVVVNPPLQTGTRVKLLLKGRENAWCSIFCQVAASDAEGASLAFLRVDAAIQVILDSLLAAEPAARPVPAAKAATAELDPYVAPAPQRRETTPRPPTPKPLPERRPQGSATGALLQRLRELRKVAE